VLEVIEDRAGLRSTIVTSQLTVALRSPQDRHTTLRKSIAIRAGHSALYLRVPRLLAELATARLDGRLPRLLAAWARIDVLGLDDFALQPLTDAQAADLKPSDVSPNLVSNKYTKQYT
jgi:DNA replication protein DnaC